MQRKKPNGNIIGARWRGIRLPGEYIAVNRRTGGLENTLTNIIKAVNVNRRTGGLEIRVPGRSYYIIVNRRTGGLEK